MHFKIYTTLIITFFFSVNLIAKDFIEALSNFIEKSNKIVLSIKPLNPVSVNDLTPDVIRQNYNGLINKLNISIGN